MKRLLQSVALLLATSSTLCFASPVPGEISEFSVNSCKGPGLALAGSSTDLSTGGTGEGNYYLDNALKNSSGIETSSPYEISIQEAGKEPYGMPAIHTSWFEFDDLSAEGSHILDTLLGLGGIPLSFAESSLIRMQVSPDPDSTYVIFELAPPGDDSGRLKGGFVGLTPVNCP